MEVVASAFRNTTVALKRKERAGEENSLPTTPSASACERASASGGRCAASERVRTEASARSESENERDRKRVVNANICSTVGRTREIAQPRHLSQR
eukprot:684584-Rhodomonas_salina.1